MWSVCPDHFFGLRNQGLRTFTVVDVFALGSDDPGAGPDAADMDGDGDQDLVGGDRGAVVAFRNNGDGLFSSPSYHATSLPHSVNSEASDLNGDGKPDLVVYPLVAGPGFSVLLNDSPPSADANEDGILDACEGFGRQVIGDGTQDGRVDISDPVWLLRHLFLGGGTVLPCSGEANPGPVDIELLDANHDRALNIIDAVSVLNYLFLGGKPSPRLGKGCEALAGCPPACLPK